MSIFNKTLVVYEDRDDYGFGGTYDSKEYGSTGPRIACCTITQLDVDWRDSKDDSMDDQVRTDERGGGRGLSAALDEDDFLIDSDEYRLLFGEESELFASELDQN